MDAFYASVELLRHPELRGQPVIVGNRGSRGVVAAASYEARYYGIHSAMSSVRAARLCPHAVFLPGDHAHYGEVSGRVMTILRSFTPLVECLSLDEAFLDVTGARRLHGTGEQIGHEIRRRILADEGLTCSVGVAPNKFLAKLASEAAKPKPSRRGAVPGAGVKVVAPGAELDFLHPLPVQALWGVGPATLAKLQRLGVRSVRDLAELTEVAVTGAVGGAVGRHLHALSHGIDDRPVVPDQPLKSVSHEETFARDEHDPERLSRETVRMADAVAARLRGHDLAGRTVTVKIRFGDFTTITRSHTLPEPVDSGQVVARVAKELLAKVDPAQGVRLLGVGVSGLANSPAHQLSFDEVTAGAGWDDATRAVDEIRERFGPEAIGPAALAAPDGGGLQVKRRGDQPWGPADATS
jgi:DNA polymerase-4